MYTILRFPFLPYDGAQHILLDNSYLHYFKTTSEEYTEGLALKIAIYTHFYMLKWKTEQNKEILEQKRISGSENSLYTDINNKLQTIFIGSALKSLNIAAVCLLLREKYTLLSTLNGAEFKRQNPPWPSCETQEKAQQTVKDHFEEIAEWMLSDLFKSFHSRKRLIKYLKCEIAAKNNQYEIEKAWKKLVNLFGFARALLLCRTFRQEFGILSDQTDDQQPMFLWEDGPSDVSLFRALKICVSEVADEYNQKFDDIKLDALFQLELTQLAKFILCMDKHLKDKRKKDGDEMVAKLHMDKMANLLEGENGDEFGAFLVKNKEKCQKLLGSDGKARIEKLLSNHEFVTASDESLHKLLLNGSFLIGSELDGSDLDLICVVSNKINVNNFYGSDDETLFTILKKKLANAKVSCISGRIQLLRIDLESFEIDLSFVPVPEKYLEQNDGGDLLREKIIEEIKYESGIYSLAAYQSAHFQLSILPDKNAFANLLKIVKVWAKTRLIYSGIFGYFNGISCSIMASKICLLFPNAPLSYLLHQFFSIYSKWDWARVPIMLNELTPITKNQIVFRWPPLIGQNPMTIITPKFPEQNTTFNVNKFTLKTIVEEFALEVVQEGCKNREEVTKDGSKCTNRCCKGHLCNGTFALQAPPLGIMGTVFGILAAAFVVWF
ncbi:hypothetical protein niasHT_032219 [Heterodera trifolii]|uniref:polynucleotide adenylyltransferase n=1 Tax=Heterodera trifolii TaxID=157864 RepID=A0ABD2HQZ7_9BILA